jgi:hypothetical protein
MQNNYQESNIDLIDWLLETENPSIRYFALRDLLDKGEDDPQVLDARQAIPDSQVVKAIIEAQRPDGGWGVRDDTTYMPKYTSTIWQMIILSDLGLPGEHPAVQKGLERMRADIESIGASDAIEQGEVLWCYSANTIRYLWRFGLGYERYTQAAVQQLIRAALSTPKWGCPYSDDTPCLWGAVKVLRAFAEIPTSEWTPEMKLVAANAAEPLVARSYMGKHESPGVTGNGWETDWLKFGFPSFYESDLLEALDALTAAGYRKDTRLKPLLNLVLEQRDEGSTWDLENSFNGRMHVDIEEKGKPSKWVTLRALRVINLINTR